MCGICGFNWFDPPLVSVMADTMVHRGPDQSGQYVDESVSLGHRRLSVIDLSEKARQPMSNEDGSLWMVFNGEIYNYPELRQWLVGRGHVFHSKADSEVVLHAYEELGFECLSMLNGMFAFAIWDKGQQTLFLARGWPATPMPREKPSSSAIARCPPYGDWSRRWPISPVFRHPHSLFPG